MRRLSTNKEQRDARRINEYTHAPEKNIFENTFLSDEADPTSVELRKFSGVAGILGYFSEFLRNFRLYLDLNLVLTVFAMKWQF